MLKIFKVEKRIQNESGDAKVKKVFVSIKNYDDLNIVITREQGARLTKNELTCVILKFLKENKNFLKEALNYEFKYTNRAIYWYTSDYGAIDYYVKFVTETDFVCSKFLFHESMSGYVLDNSNIRIFLPDLIQLIVEGCLDFANDKIILDFAKTLIDIINNKDDINLNLYKLANRLPEGSVHITDITASNDADLQELQSRDLIYNLKDLINQLTKEEKKEEKEETGEEIVGE